MEGKHVEHPIVVGVDGTPAARAAARWAAGLAVWFGVPLRLVHSMSAVDEALLIAVEARQDDAGDHPRRLGRAVLDHATEAVRADYPTLTVSEVLSHRSAEDALVEVGERARFLILATADVTAAGALLVGSTTLAVAHRAACPTIAWRGSAVAPNDQPVVVAVDEDRLSPAALTTAFELADCLGVGLTMVYAVPARRPAGEVSIPLLVDWDEIEDQARQRLSEIASRFAERWPKVAVSHVVEVGRPRRVILDHAAKAQLVVVGARGRGRIASALFGSTTLTLLHHSPVPVVICHEARQPGATNP